MYTLFKKDSPIKVYVIEFYMYVNNVFLFQYLKNKPESDGFSKGTDILN